MLRSVETSEIDFISSVGGLLGICMGVSFITVAEVFFYSVRGIMNCLGGSNQKRHHPNRINSRINALEDIDIVEDVEFDSIKYFLAFWKEVKFCNTLYILLFDLAIMSLERCIRCLEFSGKNFSLYNSICKDLLSGDAIGA